MADRPRQHSASPFHGRSPSINLKCIDLVCHYLCVSILGSSSASERIIDVDFICAPFGSRACRTPQAKVTLSYPHP